LISSIEIYTLYILRVNLYINTIDNNDLSIRRKKKVFHNIPFVISGTQSRNIDLIDEDILLQKREYQSNIEEINQYHVSWNNIISRIDELSINDNHIEISEKETKLQVNQDETIEIPTQSTVNKDELIPSLIDEKKIDQDLQSFLNSLLSHLISEQSSSDADYHNSISQTQIK